MQQEEVLYVLSEDRAHATARIDELEKEIRDLGPEFYEVFNQSSETWHDNAPFDALRERQDLLVAELTMLRQVIARANIVLPKAKKGTIGIGSKIILNSEKDIRTKYLLAGDWTPHAGKKIDDHAVVSRQSPIGQALFGKCQGDEVIVGPKQRHYVIETVQ